MTDPHLSDTESRLYNVLSAALPKDVKVSVLFRCVARRWPQPTEEYRAQQQRIGPHISRINAKLQAKRQRIVPGVSRRSYRLARIS